MDEEQLTQAETTPEEEQDRRDEEIRDFLETYPGVRPEDIPPAVWEGVQRGESLTAAYRRVETGRLRAENQQLRRSLAAERCNRQNRQRSVGTQKSSGRDGGRDAFLEALLGGE